MLKRLLQIMVLLLALLGSLRLYYRKQIGSVIDEYKGVPVYFNSVPFYRGIENTASDGYEFGKKYENFEFIKRYYYNNYKHKIVETNIDHLYDLGLKNGEFNKKNGLYQYSKVSNIQPKIGDIVLCKNMFGIYGGIVTEVGKNSVQIIRQNFWKNTRETIQIEFKNDNWIMEDKVIGRLSL